MEQQDNLLTYPHIKKRVFIFRANVLNYSETFIKEQVLALRGWQPIFLSLRHVHGLSIDELNVRFLLPQEPALLRKVWNRVNKYTNLLPPSTIRRLREDRAELMHAHFGRDAIIAWPLAQALGIPLIVTLHGYDINIHREWWEAKQDRASRNYPKQLLALAQEPNVHFIAVSQAIRRRAEQFGIPAEKITVRHIGVDTEKFAPGSVPVTARDKKVLFVGRLVEKKGCEFLLRAMARIRTSLPDASLVIVGDGPLRGELEALAEKLQIDVEFTGALSSREVGEQMDTARVFCLPSITAQNGDAEGFGMVILEAQAAGVPVVTSARGGAEEGIIDNVTGFAVTESDVEALAERLERILSDDELAARMSKEAPRFVHANFDLRDCTAALEDTYDKAITQST